MLFSNISIEIPFVCVFDIIFYICSLQIEELRIANKSLEAELDESKKVSLSIFIPVLSKHNFLVKISCVAIGWTGLDMSIQVFPKVDFLIS